MDHALFIFCSLAADLNGNSLRLVAGVTLLTATQCTGDCRANQLVVCERDRESALRAQGERGEPVNLS